MAGAFIEIGAPMRFAEADLQLEQWLTQYGATRRQIEMGLREDVVRWFDGSRKRYMLEKDLLDSLGVNHPEEL